MKFRKTFILLLISLVMVMMPVLSYAQDFDGDGYDDGPTETPWDEFAEIEGRPIETPNLPLFTICVYTYGLTPDINPKEYDSLNNMFVKMSDNYFSLYLLVENADTKETYEFDVLAEHNYQEYLDIPVGTYNVVDFGVYFRGRGVKATTSGTKYCKTTSFEITGIHSEVEFVIDIVGIWKENADISGITAKVAAEGRDIFDYVYDQHGNVQVETEAPSHAISENLEPETVPPEEETLPYETKQDETIKETEPDSENENKEESTSSLHQTFPEWLRNNIFTILLFVALVGFYLVYRKKKNKKMNIDD